MDDERSVPPGVRTNILGRYDLDAPVLEQYGRYLGNVARLDFGHSMKRQQTVAGDVRSRHHRCRRIHAVAAIRSSATKDGSTLGRGDVSYSDLCSCRLRVLGLGLHSNQFMRQNASHSNPCCFAGLTAYLRRSG